MLASATVLFVIVSFAYVVAGIAVGAAVVGTVAPAGLFVAFSIPVVWLVRLAYHMDHLGGTVPERDDVETFSGVRISKGATRADGLSALKQMLFGSPPEPKPDDEPNR